MVVSNGHAERSATPAHEFERSRMVQRATHTMVDLTMPRQELLVGDNVAGFLAGVVPTRAWSVFFLQDHGFETSLENVIVGLSSAFINFVCSIGNVPRSGKTGLLSALWCRSSSPTQSRPPC